MRRGEVPLEVVAVVVVAIVFFGVRLEPVENMVFGRCFDNAVLRLPEKARMIARTATAVAMNLNFVLLLLGCVSFEDIKQASRTQSRYTYTQW